MQLGIRAMCIYNGTAGLAALFGFPLPRVPKDWSKGAQESVELLKQESSVQEFGVVHEEVEGGTEEKKSVRGASLRDFQDFLKESGKSGDFAGLQRIGDPEDGTALWTALTDQADIENALKKRTKQRKEEELKQNEHIKKMAVEEIRKSEEGEGASGLIEATASATANGQIQKTAKKEKVSEGFGRGEISDKDGRLPVAVGTTASSNEMNKSMAKGNVVAADEINISNVSRNLVVDSEEIAKLIEAAATAAADKAAAAVAKEASEKEDRCAIM
ncbi:hypothetical protein QTG54_015080 [Skeletonema marinoi]|uniref:Uncharacterized protein n=1 Tax=Skeletonema marinoi TaxID=267567 RepID=A0AAD8XVQ0_9STRA|nr:hypothetical protein QTG54_015080 [Skeletonema marinoi]